ncbi:MAG: hypothetical protein Q9160_006453 [Pyrenula sp. 1 TL-2023]
MPTSKAKKSAAKVSVTETPTKSRKRAADDVHAVSPLVTAKRTRTTPRAGADDVAEKTSTRKSPRKKRVPHYTESDEDVSVSEEQGQSPETSRTKKRKVNKVKKTSKALGSRTKQDEEEQNPDLPASDSGGDEQHVQDTPKKRKRKTKEEKEADSMPLATRTADVRMLVGAHVSIAKGVQNAISNATRIGGNAFALFLKSQRKWDNPSLKDENRNAFLAACDDQKFDQSRHVMPHGSYLVNLAQAEPAKAKQAYDAFLDDLHRCEALGIRLYNFHPGAACGAPLPQAISRLAKQLNKALDSTKTVIPVLENAAGSGTVLGSRFSDLRDIISQIDPKHRSRIGVCIDTCHAFAAGYDLRSPEKYKSVWDDFDKIVGFKYLKGLHINDSKAPLDSKRDLHQNIGLGFLGLRAFHNVMNDSRFEGLPLILETPCEKPDPSDTTGKKTLEDKGVWAREIKLLESLIGMDPKSKNFLSLEKELNMKGKAERDKLQNQVDEKNRKAQKKTEKGQKSLSVMMGMNIGKKSVIVEDGEDEDVRLEEKATLEFKGVNGGGTEEIEETKVI